jgi:hypothetical protein
MKPLTVKQFNALNRDYTRATSRVKQWKVAGFSLEKTVTIGRKVEKRGIAPYTYDEVINEGRKAKRFDTNAYTKMIIRFLEIVYQCQPRRISSEGRWRPDKNHVEGGQFIAGQNNGLEDVQATIRGRTVAIEVKGPNDRHRPAQMRRMEQLRNDGGVYLIARPDFEQFQIDLFEHCPPDIQHIKKYLNEIVK